uniref:Nose resistant-to-fluoxetine protein N-terminal domain-containing protein n=1 Tax=Tetranychus urticae TaxID=32264 RepID=T1KPX7_TETUR
MFLINTYLVLTFFVNLVYSLASDSSNSWHLVETFTKHWLANWTQETELKYGSILLESNISSQCYNSIRQYMTKLKSFDPNAVQSKLHTFSLLVRLSVKIFNHFLVFDSSGKIPSGLLQGSWTDLGAFDECLALPSSQYCLVYSKIPLIWSRKYEGFFHPSNQQLYNHDSNPTFHRLISQYGHYFLQMNITTGICLPLGCSVDELRLLLISGLSSHNSGLQFDVDSCQTHSYPVPWKKHEIIAASILLGVVIANIIGSFTSSVPILRFFDVPSNLDKVLSSPQHTPFPCLGGIKSLTMIYLICGHVVWGLLFNSFDNLFALPSTLVNPLGLSVLLGPDTVETFFLVNGLEMMTLVAFGGPFWHHLQSAASISSTCASTWLNHLFLISHYFNSPENWNTCLLADWYLEVDFIYVILFIFFITPFLGNKTFKPILNSTLIILVGTLITAIITIVYDVQTSWLPTNFVSNQFAKYLVYIHSKPWAHLSPYFFGVIQAFAMNSDKPKINKVRTLKTLNDNNVTIT